MFLREEAVRTMDRVQLRPKRQHKTVYQVYGVPSKCIAQGRGEKGQVDGPGPSYD